MKTPLSLLLLGVLLPPLGAEDAPPAAATPAPTPGAEVEIRLFVQPVRGILTENRQIAPLPPEVTADGALEPASLRLRYGQFTPPLRLPAGFPLVLREFRDGLPGPEIVREDLPGDETKWMGVVHPTIAREDGRLRVDLFPAGPEHIPVDGHTFINTMESELQLRIGERTQRLPGGESLSLKANARRERIYIEETDTPGGRRYSGSVTQQKGRGALHIISPRPGSARRIRVLSLSDSPDTP